MSYTVPTLPYHHRRHCHHYDDHHHHHHYHDTPHHPQASRMYSCVDQCDTCPCAVPRVGLPTYAYLVEVNTAVAAVCLKGKCATVFSGALGLAASFNRTVWKQKGDVISTEMRAFSNHGGKRGLGKETGLMGFGPNINVVRDPRFGRNSELPSEDPFLNGEYVTCMPYIFRMVSSLLMLERARV